MKSSASEPGLNFVSNVCEAVARSLLWVPNALNELPEVRFELPFISGWVAQSMVNFNH